MLRHPLRRLDEVQLRRGFVLAAIASVVMLVILLWIGWPRKTSHVRLPLGMGDGIVELQFAGDPETAQKILNCWQGNKLVRAGFSIGFDYILLAAAHLGFIRLRTA